MSSVVRKAFFFASVLGFLALYCWGLRGLPPLGHYKGPYGDVLNSVATYERHVTDIVTAVNFDYRGFDTLGEEFILFISVVGVALLLRKEEHQGGGRASHTEEQDEKQHDSERQSEDKDEAPERQVPQPSDASRVFTFGLIGPMVLFGIYVVTHGHLTPGGGFQGGVVLATAPLIVYLAGSYENFKRVTSHRLIEVADSIGAGGYALVGFSAMAYGAHFLQNIIPLGTTGNINSSGTIAVIDVAVGLEVAAGFVLLLYSFLEETLERKLEQQKRKAR
jgi:multicomponent Na+:H+ antiporter subunit B